MFIWIFFFNKVQRLKSRPLECGIDECSTPTSPINSPYQTKDQKWTSHMSQHDESDHISMKIMNFRPPQVPQCISNEDTLNTGLVRVIAGRFIEGWLIEGWLIAGLIDRRSIHGGVDSSQGKIHHRVDLSQDCYIAGSIHRRIDSSQGRLIVVDSLQSRFIADSIHRRVQFIKGSIHRRIDSLESQFIADRFIVGRFIARSIYRGFIHHRTNSSQGRLFVASIHRKFDSSQAQFIARSSCHRVDSLQSYVNWKLDWSVKFFSWTYKTGFVVMLKLFRRH
jgi:hypothetical protein